MPYPIVPKKSLGIFSGLQEKFARDDAAAAAAEDKQIALEDRLARSTRQGLQDVMAQEKQQKEMQWLDARISDLNRPPVAKPDEYRVENGQRINVTRGTAEPIQGYQAPPPTPRNIDPLSEAGIRAAAQRAAAVARATPKPATQRLLPTSAVEKLTGIDNMMSMATEVRDALKGAITTKTNVTGRVGGVIPTPGWVKNLGTNIGQATGMVSDERATRAKDARALIANLYGTVAKERGGSALSEAEIGLLESYIPNGNESETDALIKANRFIKTLEAMRKNKLANYQQYGYGVDDEAPVGDQIAGLTYSPNNPFVKKTP